MGSYSKDWWIGVGVAWLIQVVVFILADKLPESSPILQWLGVFGLISFVALPFMLYIDLLHMQSVSPWEPCIWLYLLLSITPAVNIVFGIMYLYQRHKIGLRNEHGFSGKEAAISDDWWEYILAAVLFQATMLMIPYRYLDPHLTEPITVTGTVLAVTALGTSIGTGIAVAYDREYVKTMSSWTPSRLNILFGSIPPLNIAVGLYYLGMRHHWLGRHASDTDKTETDEE